MTFEQRSTKFQEEIETLQKKYSMQIYAAQVLLQNGEIVTLVKLRDLLPQTEIMDTKKHENKSKEGNITN